MIVLHECERTLEHSVLKMNWRLEGSDLAGKVLTNTEMLGSPTHVLTQPNQTRGHAGYGLFLSSFRSEQMHLDAPREVITPLYRCMNPQTLLNHSHGHAPFRKTTLHLAKWTTRS